MATQPYTLYSYCENAIESTECHSESRPAGTRNLLFIQVMMAEQQIPRGVYPEPSQVQILRFAQNDRRRARNETAVLFGLYSNAETALGFGI